MPVTKDLAVTKGVSRYITDTDFGTLPTEVIDRAKTCLLDAIGVGIAGTLSKAGRLAIDYGLSAFKEGPVSLYGSHHSLNLEGAAWTNAVLVSALDMDDGHREPVGGGRSDNVSGHAAGHPAAVVIPAAVGAAQTARASGQELLTAIVVAYEVSIRLAAARNPAIVLSNATGNWGAFAAAIASAKIQKLEMKRVTEMLGIAGAFGPNPPVSRDLGYMPMIKESIGWSCLTGVGAAELARRDFTGKDRILDNQGQFDPAMFADLGETHIILNGYFKPHSACRMTHAPIDCAVELIRTKKLPLGDIKSIIVKTSLKGSRLRDPKPQTLETAQYSIPFLVGAALRFGAVNPRTFHEGMLKDREVLGIAGKVRLEVDEPQKADPGREITFPIKSSGEIVIITEDDMSRLRIEDPKGDPLNPIKREEILEKFRNNAKEILGQDKSECLLDFLLGVDAKPHPDALAPLLTPLEP